MKSQRIAKARQQLLRIFTDALQAVEGRAAVSGWLRDNNYTESRFRVAAIGKAAASMALGADQALEHIPAGLVITKYGHGDVRLCRQARWQCLEAGHPYPDDNSLHAGRKLLAFIDATPLDIPLLFLISGGTSALVEVLPRGMGIADLETLTRELLGRSLDIGQVNQFRRALSGIKGGRLRRHLRGRRAVQLLMSDVPGDELHVIGSGLLVAAPEEQAMIPGPPWDRFAAEVPPAPRPGEFEPLPSHIVAENASARAAAALSAARRGWPVHLNEPMTGELDSVAQHIADTLQASAPGVCISGGETYLTLPDHPGHGGRCQSLALSVAWRMDGSADNWLVLAAGTDGSDGPTDDAGAIVSAQTLERGRRLGLDPQRALAGADAGRFLAQTGDLLSTGPTGTNVMDLCIACKLAD